MTWGRPDALLWLWAAPLLALFLWWAWRSRRRALLGLGPLVDGLVSPDASRLHAARAVMWFFALVLGVVAVAQPRWGFRWQELKREGLELVVVLDVSTSMDATDVSPSRMERARREVLDLADQLVGDKVGLVLAAGGAYPRMPLTLDYDALRQMVKDSDTTTLRAQGSDLAAAIDAAAKLLGPQQSADRAILLVSDGEDHSEHAVEAAERAAAEGIHIYVLGVGTGEGAPIPLADGGFKKDRSGRVVLSHLEEGTLQDIARAGSGAYVRSVAGNADVRALYLDEIRGKLQGAELGSRRDKVWNERYQVPLGAALLLLVAAGALRPRPLRLARSVRQATLVLLTVGALGGVARAEDRGVSTDPAIERLLAEQVAHPDDLGIAERLGAALYGAGDYSRAEELLGDVADRTLDPAQRERARYNAGLAAYRGGRLTEAVDAWTQVLGEQPDNEGARQNAETVQKEIEMRMQQDQQPQDQQPQDQQPQDQQPQDQQPQDQQPQDQQPQDQQPQDQQPQDQQQQDQQQQAGQPDDQGERQERQPPDSPDDQGEVGERGPIEPQDEQGDSGSALSAGESNAPPENISESEARRLLESIEEGSPRVTRQDAAGAEKDW